MTRVRLDQLPANVRRQVEADMQDRSDAEMQAGASHRKPRPRRTDSAPCPGTCGCGATFPNYLAWEHHADTTGHGRWNIDLEPTDAT